MNITQFKKILPVLRLIEAAPIKDKKARTIDIRHVVDDTLGDGSGGGDYLVITAQDLTTSLEIKALGINTSNYHACVNLDKFNKLILTLKAMPSFDWESGSGGDALVLESGKRVIRLDSTKLQRMDYGEREFIPFADIEHQWNVSRLIEGLRYVSPAMSNDETRFHLNGVLWAPNGDMVTTDGHRLHIYSYHHFDDTPSKFFEHPDTILPRQHVTMLLAAIKACGGNTAEVYSQRSADWMQFMVSGGQLSFKITCKLVDSKFPPYDRVIPKGYSARAVVNTAAFVEATKLLTKMSDTVNNTVEFHLNGQLHLKGGGVSESLDATYEGEGFEYGEIGADSRYLVDAAANLPEDDFTIEFGKGLDPIKFTQRGGFLAVVMPVRV